MQTTWKRFARWTTLSLAAVGVMGSRADAGFTVSYEAAKVQQTSVSNATTETFDNYPVGVYKNVNDSSSAVGTFVSPAVAVVAHNDYGGAGGTGNYFAIGSESGSTTASLTFKGGAQSYFGFWWSAADAGNAVDLYSAGKLIGTLATSSILNQLSSAYNGNPNTGGDTGEKFAYLNIYGTNGTTFDQVVFRNATTGTGFELDNISIATAYNSVTGTVVPNAVVPEPSSLAMLGIAGVVGSGAWFRRARRNPEA